MPLREALQNAIDELLNMDCDDRDEVVGIVSEVTGALRSLAACVPVDAERESTPDEMGTDELVDYLMGTGTCVSNDGLDLSLICKRSAKALLYLPPAEARLRRILERDIPDLCEEIERLRVPVDAERGERDDLLLPLGNALAQHKALHHAHDGTAWFAYDCLARDETLRRAAADFIQSAFLESVLARVVAVPPNQKENDMQELTKIRIAMDVIADGRRAGDESLDGRDGVDDHVGFEIEAIGSRARVNLDRVTWLEMGEPRHIVVTVEPSLAERELRTHR